ncbi:hypothetical protein GALL_465690 [mine drainage metagenome]|uniref:Uncharacterized protein n=1 Tax=mine drainage metagenome TaxID=410659 RepID=A0A1J5PLW0_9ZZZZ
MATGIKPFKVSAAAAFGINGNHNALRTIFGRGILDHLGVGNSRRIKTGFICPRIKQTANIIHRAHATAHSQRDKYLAGDRLNDVQNQIPPITGGRDVKESQFVGTLLVVACRDFHRVTGIAQFDKIDTFNDATTGHVQARDDAFSEHGWIVEVWLSCCGGWCVHPFQQKQARFWLGLR